MTAETIAKHLDAKRSGPGRWMARCVAHEERTASLSIVERHGVVLVHCFAGCDQPAVIAALRAQGLWPERERREFTHQEREDWRQLQADRRAARFWAMAVRDLAEGLLEQIPRTDPDRATLTELVATTKGFGLLDEFLRWRRADAKFATALVRAGRAAELRRQEALAAYIAELGASDAAA